MDNLFEAADSDVESKVYQGLYCITVLKSVVEYYERERDGLGECDYLHLIQHSFLAQSHIHNKT